MSKKERNMEGFGKETAFISIRGMIQFAIKQADLVLGKDENVRIDIPEIARRFCKGEVVNFKDGRELVLDPIGEGILITCETAEKLFKGGGKAEIAIEASRITIAKVLTDILLRKSCKGTDVIGKVKLPFIQAFNTLLQYEFLGGGV